MPCTYHIPLARGYRPNCSYSPGQFFRHKESLPELKAKNLNPVTDCKAQRWKCMTWLVHEMTWNADLGFPWVAAPTSLPKKMWDIAHCIRSKQVDFSPTRIHISQICVSMHHIAKEVASKFTWNFHFNPLPHLPANSCKASPCKTHTAWQCRGGVCWQPFWKLLQHLDIKNGLERLLNMVQQHRCGNGGAWAIGI